jgi:hypothetical protein
MPDLSHHRHGTIGVPILGEILIDLRCSKQREDCNRKTLDHSGPMERPPTGSAAATFEGEFAGNGVVRYAW